MDQFEADFAVLKRSATILALIFVASATLVWITGSYKQSQSLVLERTRAELNTQRAEFRFAVEAGDIMQTSQQRYAELEQTHFIGKEQRLLWIESLRNTGYQHQLYNLRYNLKQQRALYDDDNAYEYYQLYASPMSLHLELKHEGYLAEFFNTLTQERPAIYQLQSCSLTSRFGEDGVNLNSPNIAADCDLVWYTLRPFSSDSEANNESS